jgi:SAM-dependent methyltransferase
MEEVHLWRGTAEQQALRDQFGNSGHFSYFHEQLDYPQWAGKKVLDFGGNTGGLLLSSGCTIQPEDYYCVDVLQEALERGRQRLPQAHWIHFDRYNCSFNPEGIKDLAIPDMGIEFDMILAFSVFTHTTREEMRDLVGQLRARLAPGGKLAFTFIDPHFNAWPKRYDGNNLKWRLERSRQMHPEIDVDRLLEQSRSAAWCALVDGKKLYVDDNGVWGNETEICMTYNVFYTVEFLQQEFPGAQIRLPVQNQMQHCCIMSRSK